MPLDAFRYRLPLTAPLALPGRTLTERVGLLVRLSDAEGRTAWGEAAPLPGFSHETLADVAEAARRLRADDAPPADRDRPPALRFALDTAGAGLEAAVRGATLPHVLADDPAASVPLNALLTDATDTGDLAERAQDLRRAGYAAVKLKVGRRDVEEDARRVHRVAEALGDDVALRLDANRAWSTGEAARFAQTVRGVRVAYLEEPLARPASLPRFAAAFPHLPVALDETTRERGPDVLDELPVRAVILKPTLLGAFAATRRWARAARRRGAEVVLSTCFETDVGRFALVALAATLGDGRTAHGLDAPPFAHDLLDPAPTWTPPTLDVRALFQAGAAPRLDLLEKL